MSAIRKNLFIFDLLLKIRDLRIDWPPLSRPAPPCQLPKSMQKFAPVIADLQFKFLQLLLGALNK